MIDSDYMKIYLQWFDRIALEFNQDKDFDTYIAKYSCYMRFSYGSNDGPYKIPETAGNPERVICNQASNEEGSQTIMGTSEDDGIVGHSEESENTERVRLEMALRPISQLIIH